MASWPSLADPSDLEGTTPPLGANRAGRAQSEADPASQDTNREDHAGPLTKTRQRLGTRPAKIWYNKEGGHPTCMHLV